MQQQEKVVPLDSGGKVFYAINQQDSSGNYPRLQYRLRQYLKLAGIKNFRWHDLRHTCASQLVMKDRDLLVVMKYLRHQSFKTTLRYAHLGESKLLDEAGVLDNWQDKRSQTGTKTGTTRFLRRGEAPLPLPPSLYNPPRKFYSHY